MLAEQVKDCKIQRVALEYSLHLSNASLIAVAGDSGVGKTTLVEALQEIFPYDKAVKLETDR